MPVCMRCGTLNTTDACVVCAPQTASAPAQQQQAPEQWGSQPSVQQSGFSKAADFDHLFNTPPPGQEGDGLMSYGTDEGRRETMPAAPLHSSKKKEKLGVFTKKFSGKIGEGAKKLSSVARNAASPKGSWDGASSGINEMEPERMVVDLKPAAASPRALLDQAARQRYKELFPDASDHISLAGELWCKAVSGSDVLEGIFYVSPFSFSFAAPHNGMRVAAHVPFKDVLDIRPGEVHWGGSAALDRQVTCREVEGVGQGTNSVRIYTRDKQVHVFFDGELIDSFSRWLGLVYYYWKEPSMSTTALATPPSRTSRLSYQPSGNYSPALSSFDHASQSSVSTAPFPSMDQPPAQQTEPQPPAQQYAQPQGSGQGQFTQQPFDQGQFTQQAFDEGQPTQQPYQAGAAQAYANQQAPVGYSAAVGGTPQRQPYQSTQADAQPAQEPSGGAFRNSVPLGGMAGSTSGASPLSPYPGASAAPAALGEFDSDVPPTYEESEALQKLVLQAGPDAFA